MNIHCPYFILNIDYLYWELCLFACLMMFNATFNNISVISWRSILLVKKIEGPGKNHRPVAGHWQTLSHNVEHLALIEIRAHNITSVVIGTDCIGSCKSNYHAITVTKIMIRLPFIRLKSPNVIKSRMSIDLLLLHIAFEVFLCTSVRIESRQLFQIDIV